MQIYTLAVDFNYLRRGHRLIIFGNVFASEKVYRFRLGQFRAAYLKFGGRLGLSNLPPVVFSPVMKGRATTQIPSSKGWRSGTWRGSHLPG